jgi:CBS domain-containing protein
MSKEVTTIMQSASLSDAINLMGEKEVSRLPVVGEKGELVGIITRKDIVHEIAKIKNI